MKIKSNTIILIIFLTISNVMTSIPIYTCYTINNDMNEDILNSINTNNNVISKDISNKILNSKYYDVKKHLSDFLPFEFINNQIVFNSQRFTSEIDTVNSIYDIINRKLNNSALNYEIVKDEMINREITETIIFSPTKKMSLQKNFFCEYYFLGKYNEVFFWNTYFYNMYEYLIIYKKNNTSQLILLWVDDNFNIHRYDNYTLNEGLAILKK